MKTTHLLLASIFLGIVLTGCLQDQEPVLDKEDPKVIDPSSEVISFLANLNWDLMQNKSLSYLRDSDGSDVIRFSDGNVLGSSKIDRDEDEVEVTFKVKEISAQEAMTLWWIIFNNPGACATAPCGPDDLSDPTVNASVGFAAGQVVGSNGKLRLEASLEVGDTEGFLFGPGLVDGELAELHMVGRSHGEEIAACMPAQISSLNGGCDGMPGDCNNVCEDTHFAIHLAEIDDDDDDFEGPFNATVDLTAAAIDPGEAQVINGILQVRGQVNEGPLTGDIEGTTITVFNANIDQATGNGLGFGTVTHVVTKVRGQTVNGVWTGDFEGQITGPSFTGTFNGQGEGDLKETSLQSSFSDVLVDNIFQLAGTILDDDEDDEDDDDDDDDD